ncbi:MAG: T9SS type A sorting domain-containing protein, partial [Saprospiraceae bacterium]
LKGAWDEPEFQLPLGFDFHFFDITTDHIYSIPNSFGIDLEMNQDLNHLYYLIPFYGNLIDRGYSQDSALSPITYQTVGNPGQRIFTLEYKEAGFFEGLEDTNSIIIDYISIQVKLFEASGDIVFHIGPYSVLEEPQIVFDDNPGPIIGLLANREINPVPHFGELILLEGNPLKPTIQTDTITFLHWPIPENTMYRFSRMGTSVVDHSHLLNDHLLIPNPASCDLHLNQTIAKEINYPIIVMDMMGRKVSQWNKESEISVVNLTAGCYYIILRTKNETFTEKLLVVHD